MRKAFVALLLLAGAALFVSNMAVAKEYLSDDGVSGERLASPQFHREVSRASRLGTSVGNPNGSDTIWVGYSPGHFNASNNYWSVYAHRGRDGNLEPNTQPGSLPADVGGQGPEQGPAGQGQWGFEGSEAAWAGDSLQGWMAYNCQYISTAGQTLNDWQRPWWSLDYGNSINAAPAGHKGRTWGVVGVWHRDDAGAAVGANRPDGTPHAFGTEWAGGTGQHGGGSAGLGDGTGAQPAWTPIGGSFSAWMGLRAHNDVRFVDPITGNGYNHSGGTFFLVGTSFDGDGSDIAMPGYCSQMDQMLYRDIDMSGATASDLTITFKYSTDMSTGFSTSSTTRNGWFHFDPLQQTNNGGGSNAAVGNFISSNDATNTNAPRDSFMVYVGAPTGATFKASDGQTYPTDPLRKWFSETIQAVDGYYVQLLSVAGINGSGGGGSAIPASFTVPNSALTDILANGNNKVRLVFRVKTNRGYDDDHIFGEAYSSGKNGAAQVDDVTYSHTGGSSPAGWGDFEAAGSIDNTADALDAWRSTGKPPFASGHVENILAAGLAYDDICGSLLSTTRQCDVSGNIVTFGWHDLGHTHGNLILGSAEQEFHQTLISPAINFATPVAGDNNMGLDADDVVADEDYYIDIDLYSATMDPGTYGDYWRVFINTYPGSDAYGNATWSGYNPVPYIIFSGPDAQCFQDFADHPMALWGNLENSNASGIPDSVKIGIQLWQRCFRDQAPQCFTTRGAYYDNLSLCIIDGLPQAISVNIWDLLNDTFPSNETVTPGDKAAFDTTAAVVKIGRAIGSDFVTGKRYPTPGDSVTISTSDVAGGYSVHMIFRVFPGPGNYVTNGRPDLDGDFNLRKVPTSATPISNGDLTNFWSNYIADNGAHGTAGGHVAAAGRGRWNPNVWNSARCDTAETNLFPNGGVSGATPNAVVPVPTTFMSYYHDTDAKGSSAQLGVLKTRCFLTNVGGPLPDVTCNGTVPAWVGISGVANPATGWDGNVFTYEYTKILPDGLFTPGTHVQYFFAKYDNGNNLLAMVPDTTVVFPQNAESSTDGHRWQQWSVLPDTWKSSDHKHPFTGQFGEGLACMLVVDNNDRRGNERVWVSIADTIGATAAVKRGSHDGWSAVGNTGQTTTTGVNDPATFVARNYGQPGTTWDLYNTKASESLGTSAGHLGGRLSPRPIGNTQIFGVAASEFPGKSSRMGPTPAMLEAYYNILFWMSGDLNTQVLSPMGQRTADEVTLIRNWLLSGQTDVSANRGFYAVGDGFVEDAILTPTSTAAHMSLMTDVFGVDLESNSYQGLSGNLNAVHDMTTAAGIVSASPHTYGIRNVCLWTNDVLKTTALGTSVASEYENVGVNGPYPSGVYHAWKDTEPYISLVDGWDIEHLTGHADVSTGGRLYYYQQMLSNVFADITCFALGGTINGLVLDAPSRDFGNYVRLANTPLRNGSARIDLSLARADRVEVKVFDVSGRLVRTLADRMFEAGEHPLFWDGTDNAGRSVARGVYFTQVSYKNANWQDAKKITVLQ